MRKLNKWAILTWLTLFVLAMVGCDSAIGPPVYGGSDPAADAAIPAVPPKENCSGETSLGSTCLVGIGACQRVGFTKCSALGKVECSATAGPPSTEICDGVDNNCDGIADNDISCPSCKSTPEVCDGIDNDCNGKVDEGCPIGLPCIDGVGVCQRVGIYLVDGKGGVKCSATAGTPSPEICDGLDNNCDGLADNGIVCPTCKPTTEICDGIDNDCDGLVDEGCPIGSACSVGVGACQRTGIYIADSTTGGVKCTASPGPAGVEICNGIDDNCNGSADEGLSCTCKPSLEVCDGVDNNCNGSVDEGFGLGSTCTVGIGACQRTGLIVCDGLGSTMCSAKPGTAGVETCNGIDDNCNGSADEGLSCACTPKPEVCDGVDNDCNGKVDELFALGTVCQVGVGSCQRFGTIQCTVGGGTACSATPGAPGIEICDGIDNDCNGSVDEGLSCTCAPKAEVCNGIDDNCNGKVDEGFPVGAACTVGIGSCANTGYFVCDPATGGVKCSATAGAPKAEICNGIDDNCNGSADEGLACTCSPSVEVCDGIDNNCNGSIDEGFGVGTTCSVGVGACTRFGLKVCDGAGAVKCSATPGPTAVETCNGIDDNCNGTADEGLSCTCSPSTEVCDGVDNNCDGKVDEGCPIGLPCSVGVGACTRNGLFIIDGKGGVKCSATAGAPSPEVCDGVDNNCDGLADNGLTCTFVAKPEVCNGIDDNLNGAVDEGFPVGGTCLVGVGACQRLGYFLCDPVTGGVKCSVTPGTPGAETCNGIDDDCNGVADNGISCPVCIPKPEVCDGVDNDCDGLVDEGFPIGGTCSAGVGACLQTGVFICNGSGAIMCSVSGGTPKAEVCNGIDDNCNGTSDEGLLCTCFPTVEKCDGLDNNCNGSVDEGFGVGAPCTVGTGACTRIGVNLCKADGTVACSVTPGTPTAEVCNGIDDDCNGAIDNGLSCLLVAKPEICDGIDNNLNGVVDEGFPVGMNCIVGVGACTRTGLFLCNGAGGVTCSATAGAPGVEVCDGIDNNCDGLVDNVPGVSCTCSPKPETCNGLDDNCNGVIDDGFSPGLTCTVGIGRCQRTGYLICTALGTTCSASAGVPNAETCNGIDDNCNGLVDDGIVCGCSPSAEICDGIDNNCNGSVDEGFSLGSLCSVGTGKCRRNGITVCNGLGGSTCSVTPGTPDPFETCGNGIDDDCDGVTDEAACF